MLPKKIQPYFRTTHQTMEGDNSLIKGILTCCNDHDFEVFVFGRMKHSIFSKMCLYPDDGRTVIEVRCRKCGKVISVFDSSCDGYGQCGKEQYTHVTTKPVDCKKCNNRGFSVGITFEYPDTQDLFAIEISEIDNAFSWIWITLECNNCGSKYRNIVDCETT